MMRFIELFAGIGGFRLGLKQTNKSRATVRGAERRSVQPNGDKPDSKGRYNSQSEARRHRLKQQSQDFTCVWANENDKWACEIYRKNFGKGELYEGDIRQVKAENIPDHELLTAGFPCQSFSIAGKRGGFDDTRGTLFYEIARILAIKRPPLLLLENVKGLLSHDNGNTFGTILTTLSELGYFLQWQILNSKDFGVPQNRERVFIVGHLGKGCARQVFPVGKSNQFFRKDSINKQRKKIGSAIRPGMSGLPASGETYIYAITDSGLHRQKQIRKDILPPLRAERGCDRKDTVQITDGKSIRRLTPTECERLQGFPDGFTEGISDTQRYKVLGNAITVNVIQAIGERLIAPHYY